MDDNLPASFSEWLQRRRKSLDLTRAELADRAGCSVSALRKIEAGERRPSKQLAELLARSLEIPPQSLAAFLRVARGELNLERLPPPSTRESASPAAAAPVHTTLPLQPGRLVGRESELAALLHLVADPECRLLTLTGLGGMGKTRLAIELGKASQDQFSGGIYFSSLAPLRSPELIAPAIGEALQVSFSGGHDLERQLLHALALRPRPPFLLILDNLEHLLEPEQAGREARLTSLIPALLQAAPGLKILATSRERLYLPAEWTFELHGLPVPAGELGEALEENSAAMLFLQHARRINSDYHLPPGERAALASICRSVSGIPLAIELAAAWTRILSCQEIAAEIQTNLDFLRTSMHGIPERHRSLRAALDHSWKLLAGPERQVFARLAIFQGGFRREAAAQIAAADLDSLASLASKSLIRRTDQGRYDLHEVVRQFGLSHLLDDPEYQEICRRHSLYFLGRLAEMENEVRGAGQPEAIQFLVSEKDNLWAAWAWARERGELVPLQRALRSFGWFCNVKGWLEEGTDLLQTLIESLRGGEKDLSVPAGRQAVLGQALAEQGQLLFRRGYFGHASAVYEESLALLEEVADPALLTAPLVISAIILHLDGKYDQSQERSRAGLQCASRSDDPWYSAYARFNLGYVDSLKGRLEPGLAEMQAAQEIWRALGDPSAGAIGLNHMAQAAIQLGQHDQAEAYLEEALLLTLRSGDRWGTGTAYRGMGLLALSRGKAEQANGLFLKSLDIFNQISTGWDIARSLIYLAETEDERAARNTLRQALRLAWETQSQPLQLEALTGLARLDMEAGQAARPCTVLNLVLRHSAAAYPVHEHARQLLDELGRQTEIEALASYDAPFAGRSLDEVLAKLTGAVLDVPA